MKVCSVTSWWSSFSFLSRLTACRLCFTARTCWCASAGSHLNLCRWRIWGNTRWRSCPTWLPVPTATMSTKTMKVRKTLGHITQSSPGLCPTTWRLQAPIVLTQCADLMCTASFAKCTSLSLPPRHFHPPLLFLWFPSRISSLHPPVFLLHAPHVWLTSLPLSYLCVSFSFQNSLLSCVCLWDSPNPWDFPRIFCLLVCQSDNTRTSALGPADALYLSAGDLVSQTLLYFL